MKLGIFYRILFFSIVAGIVLFSCRKAIIQPDADRIDVLRQWYQARIIAPAQSLDVLYDKQQAKVSSAEANMPLLPEWDRSVSYSINDSIITEVPVTTTGKFGLALPGVDNRGQAPSSFTRLVFVENKQGTSAFFMTIAASLSYLQQYPQALLENTLKRKSYGFSGLVILRSVEGVFLSGEWYQQGRRAGYVSPAAATVKRAPRVKGVTDPGNDDGDCIQVIIEYWTMTCYYANGSSTPDHCDPPVTTNLEVFNICPGDDPGSGGSSGGSVNPVDISRDTSILNNPKAKCILDKLENHNTKFDSLLNAFKGKGFNLSFNLANLRTPTSTPNGNTTNPDDGPNFVTTLDRQFVRDATQIEIAKTFLHEAFHANLSQHAYELFGSVHVAQWSKRPEDMTITELMNIISSDVAGTSLETIEHQYMANHIAVIADGLREIMTQYGNGSTFDDDCYLGMAFDGLTGTMFYQDFVKDKMKGEYTLSFFLSAKKNEIKSFSVINCP